VDTGSQGEIKMRKDFIVQIRIGDLGLVHYLSSFNNLDIVHYTGENSMTDIHCVIASWAKDPEGHYVLFFTGDRPIELKVDPGDFFTLAKIGQSIMDGIGYNRE
jgi:hypothetical protein